MDYFIDHANYKDTEIYIKGAGLIPLKRGQHIFGTLSLADLMGVDRQRVRSKLKILKNINFLTIKTTNRFSIATIINYDTYNPQENTTNQQTNQRLTSNQPATNQLLTTPKEYNKDKKGNNNTYSVSFSSFWNEYPVKKGKGSAYKSWLKKKPDIENVLLAIKNQIDEKEKLKANQQFCPEWPHPTTWLNQERWDDEEYDIKGEEDGLARFLQRHQDTG